MSTPYARERARIAQREAELDGDFAEFAKVWILEGGSVQQKMVSYYFRQFFPEKYKFIDDIKDEQIDELLAKWNAEVGKATKNEMGMYVGIQINLEVERKKAAEESKRKKEMAIKMSLAEAKKLGVKPPMATLKEAVALGIIELPKKVEAEDEPQPKKPNARELFRSSRREEKKERKEKKKESKKESKKDSKSERSSKSSKKDKDKDKHKSSKDKDSDKDKDRERDKDRKKKSSKKDKKDSELQWSRHHDKDKDKDKDKERDKEKSRDKDRDKDKDDKKSSKSSSKEKEKKSSSSSKSDKKEKKKEDKKHHKR